MMSAEEKLNNHNLDDGAGERAQVLELPMPDDFHVHLRQGPMLQAYVRRLAATCGRALVMPNTEPPIASADAIVQYRCKIEEAAEIGFVPLMTFKLLPGMAARTVDECACAGALAGKYYPCGATTNAADGPRRPEDVAAALSAMEAAGLVLSVHAERPGAPAFQREKLFLPTIDCILDTWPRLRVVIEHVSSRETIDYINSRPDRLAGTITAHHLLFTIDDMLGEGLDPSLFCKPLIKFEEDRGALRQAVFSCSPRFFFGSDSAPHPVQAKLKRNAPGGIYASPTEIPALAGLFEQHGALDALPAFLAKNGAAFYGLPVTGQTLRLTRKRWLVPEEVDGCIPLCAGKELDWSLETDGS
ncbi:MAG: dihydroorotase [Spirochaetaceae bacterium]|nr:dihydroorotase [Spirochaetaceae bacterium]